MYFKCSIRRHPESGSISGYYRLVESYRNEVDRICHRTILNVGFMEDTTAEQRNAIQKYLTKKQEHQSLIFEESDVVITKYVDALWQRIVEEQRLDIILPEKDLTRLVNVDTLIHKNVREVGSEWMSYQTWKKLGLSELLHSKGWREEDIGLAATQIISRAVYPSSELKTSRWIQENSAICEVTGYDINKITKDKLYQSALQLYEIKDDLEKHLSSRTNELFDLQDKIILYDLTNTYFEGRKQTSQLAKFGRSKEKRNDAKLVVLALVVNMEGFIKYSSIHQGNIADCQTLSQMIDKLKCHTCPQNAIVVIDAGIATEQNLQLINEKGYHYLCVSRSKLKDYQAIANKQPVILETKSRQTVKLKAIQTDNNTDYYLEVRSDAKALKEQSMSGQFEQRFEALLKNIQQSLFKKRGIKQVERVWERIGRAKEKYPSVHHYYNIELSTDDSKIIATDMQWTKNTALSVPKEGQYGLYFLRTDLNIDNEVIVWNIYNTIREIESTFRTLKTELDLRPVYHKTDKAVMAHLHLGILAYWLVNTIRYQLKQQNIHHCWTEIVRIGNTQKLVTTIAKNVSNKTMQIRRCSEPNENLKQVFCALKIPIKIFEKRKCVVHKPELKKIKPLQLTTFPPD